MSNSGQYGPGHTAPGPRRLVTSDDVAAAVIVAKQTGEAIPDEVAMTIASYWHSPGASVLERSLATLSSRGPERVGALGLEAIAELPARNWADLSDEPENNYDDLSALKAWARQRLRS